MRLSIISPIMCLSDELAEMTQKMISDIRREITADDEFIIVDNASTHGKTIMKEGADIYIELPENKGWGGGLNVGMKEAKGDYLVLVNNDIIIEPGWSLKLIERFESNPKIGLVSINNRGGFTGAFFALKRDVYNKIGEFDEKNYPLGHAQDCDYLYRVLYEGWTDSVVVYEKFWHHTRQTYNQSEFRNKYLKNPNFSKSDFNIKWGFAAHEWERLGHLHWEERILNDPSLDRFHELDKIKERRNAKSE